MKTPVLIGIAGPSGSGKTFVADQVLQNLGSDKAVLIQEDSYYNDLSHVPYDERAAANFDHPDAFDHDLLAEHLLQLAKGRTISQPVYDYKRHIRLKETKTIWPRDIIVLEGILTLHNPSLRELMDIRVFIDTPLDICFIRRLKRDIAERARTPDSVIRQYQDTVRPMYLRFIEPSKQYADLVIHGADDSPEAVDALIARIGSLLQNSRK